MAFTRFVVGMFVASFCAACGAVLYNPWQSNIPQHMTDLTRKNLLRLQSQPGQLPLRIGLVADPQGTPKDLVEVLHLLNQAKPEFILVLGDLTDYGLRQEYIWAYEALKTAKVPYLTVVGNHDALASGRSLYKTMFGPYSYTFTHAGVEFVMWNNNKREFNLASPDWDWLLSRLHPRAIVAAHIPPVEDTNYSQAEVNAWKAEEAKAGILASIHGHKHTSWYWREGGVHYYIAPRVRGVKYGILTIEADFSLHFQSCEPKCFMEN